MGLLLGYRLVNGLCFRLEELRQPACSSPRNDGTCVRCNPPYYLNTDGQCYNILIDNCVSATGIVCTQCQQSKRCILYRLRINKWRLLQTSQTRRPKLQRREPDIRRLHRLQPTILPQLQRLLHKTRPLLPDHQP